MAVTLQNRAIYAFIVLTVESRRSAPSEGRSITKSTGLNLHHHMASATFPMWSDLSTTTLEIEELLDWTPLEIVFQRLMPKYQSVSCQQVYLRIFSSS
ncbi:MAG: hypothetical protein DCF29_13305 [Alphaproteobacteria bacterium]|nr:MAG: hypothetical protein DCF29_13305 [Alphaproteobacteria bacterium]